MIPNRRLLRKGLRRPAPVLLASLFVLATTMLAAADSIPAQAVQLRDGSILVGEIQHPDGEGFTLQRTDNGGILQLRWSHLTESSARLLKSANNLLAEGVAEVTVRADVLRFVGATGQIEERMGRISNETPTHIEIRRKGIVTPVRRKSIRGQSERQVTPFEIFTKDEYYADQLASAAPGEDADKHMALGEHLMQIRDYEHAKIHFDKAKALGGGRQKAILDERIVHLALLQSASKEQELLDEIRTETNRGRFQSAGEKIEAFKKEFPQTKLRAEFDRNVENYTNVRKKDLTQQVAARWYKQVDILAGAKARAKPTLAEAKRYAEREMGKEIRDQIAQSLGTTVDEVEQLWQNRNAVRGAGSSQRYYYSVGSWLLGAKEILVGTKQGEVEKKDAEREQRTDEQKKLDDDVKRIQEAMRRANAQRNASRNPNAEKKETPEEWWADASPQARDTWIKAYYAEFSGDMERTDAFLEDCKPCGGSGRIAAQGSTTATQLTECGTCKGTRFQRNIRAR
jgi:hypothetical protein